jgi:uncharacterized protein (TIGR03435 family)
VTVRLTGTVVFLGISAFGQSRPQFEVASVKPSAPEATRRRFNLSSGSLTMLNASLRDCILMAYGVALYQIAPLPKWMDSEKYDIVAKMGDGGDEQPAPSGPAMREQLTVRLQTLLEDRFQLKAHRENRTIPIYALTVAKGGLLLKEGADVKGDAGVTGTPTTIRWTRRNATMSSLAISLSTNVDRPVLDQTGIQGLYSFVLEYAKDVPASATGAPSDAPTIFEALQKQLGLRLEATKGEVEFFVVDSAERPSAN